MERVILVAQAPEQALDASARALAQASFTKIDVDEAGLLASAEKRLAARWSRGALTVAAEPADRDQTKLTISVEMRTRPRVSVFTSDPRAQLIDDFIEALAQIVAVTR